MLMLTNTQRMNSLINYGGDAMIKTIGKIFKKYIDDILATMGLICFAVAAFSFMWQAGICVVGIILLILAYTISKAMDSR